MKTFDECNYIQNIKLQFLKHIYHPLLYQKKINQ